MAATPIDSLSKSTLPELIKAAASVHGDREFVVLGTERMSFRDADESSAELARGLLALGVGKGSRVGLLMPNSPDWVACWFASARTGALTVALSTFFQAPEISWALRHNDIDTLLIAASYLNNDYLERLERALPGLAEQRSPELFLPTHPFLRRIIVWGATDRPWALQGPASLQDAARRNASVDDRFLAQVEANIAPADPLLTICTSGSTAEPKAVVHCHRVAVEATREFLPYYDFQPNDRSYSGHPFFWIGGLNVNLLPALYVGDCQVCSSSPKPHALAALTEQERLTRLSIWPSQAAGIREAAARDGRDLSSVRVGLADALDEDGQPIGPERRYGGVFGMTETFGMHSLEVLNRPVPPEKAGSNGRPLPGLERRIVDPQTGEALGPGKVGELQIRGHTLMLGYYKKPRDEVFTADGFFPTGDLCFVDEEDWLFFKGRASEMIKTSGANVSPREVEIALMAQGGLREAHVLGLPDTLKGEIVAAVLVPAPGDTRDTPERLAQLRHDISPYKVPSRVEVMAYEDVPRTLSGKPDKGRLRALLAAN
jgi:acyl-CoA synthetase (AMP-forming)/AMP-acid ligase II